jgi:hypothetical protein
MIINSNKAEVNVHVFAIKQAEMHKEKKGTLRGAGSVARARKAQGSSDLRSRGQTKENV